MQRYSFKKYVRAVCTVTKVYKFLPHLHFWKTKCIHFQVGGLCFWTLLGALSCPQTSVIGSHFALSMWDPTVKRKFTPVTMTSQQWYCIQRKPSLTGLHSFWIWITGGWWVGTEGLTSVPVCVTRLSVCLSVQSSYFNQSKLFLMRAMSCTSSNLRRFSCVIFVVLCLPYQSCRTVDSALGINVSRCMLHLCMHSWLI